MWNAVWAAANKASDALELVTMVKLFAAETYVKVSNQAMQIFGGNGCSTEYPIDATIATAACTPWRRDPLRCCAT
jgi:alkylation response protein AidB-like acyl-CoA dehydrogenase